MAACSLTLLGGFGLRSADGVELALSTRKDRLLLAYLALNAARPLARERLAGLLWGDRGEAQARDSLRQSLAAIRQAFRQVGLDPLVTDRESVRFDPSGIGVDAADFAGLAEDDRTACQAAALYRGELLDGLDGATPEFRAWLDPERERLAALAISLVDRLARSAQPGEAATRLARHLLARDPVCEPVYRALMRLNAAAGDRAAALKLYATCRDTLKRELGVGPELQTETLYRDILTERPSADPGDAPAGGDAAAGAERPSIAVLPFDNISRDPQLDHLCDGIAENIITGLGRFRLLFVIDRYSSSAIARQTSDVAEIGRRLGVVRLVQGSLQRLGDRLRITVRLLDAASRTQHWGESFDAALVDVVNVPDKITGAIVSSLHWRVEQSLIEQSRRKPSPAAYECLLRGIKHLRGYAPDDNDRAIALFQQAIELDPDYALARAYRGFADVVKHGYDDAPKEVLQAARAAIATAVQMDEQEGRCHWLLGIVAAYLYDTKAEEWHFLRALALNPNDANAMAAYGGTLGTLGRYDEGIEMVRAAMRLNPYHPEWYWISLGSILYQSRRYEDALEAFGRRANPGHWVVARIAACHAQLGRMEEATEAAAKVLRLKPGFSVAAVRRAGWTEDQNRHMQEGLRKAGLPD